MRPVNYESGWPLSTVSPNAAASYFAMIDRHSGSHLDWNIEHAQADYT